MLKNKMISTGGKLCFYSSVHYAVWSLCVFEKLVSLLMHVFQKLTIETLAADLST